MATLKKIKFLLPLIPLFALAGCDMDNPENVRNLLQLFLIAAGTILLGIVYFFKAILPKKKANPSASTPHTPPPLPPPISTINNPDAPVHQPPKENNPQQ